MRLIIISYSSSMYWKINKDFPTTYNLKSLPNFVFINPLLYPQLFNGKLPNAVIPLLILENEIIIQTNSIVFGMETDSFDVNSIPFKLVPHKVINLNTSPPTKDEFNGIISAYAVEFASSLRLISKQVTISSNVLHLQYSQTTSLPDVSFPKAVSNNEASIQRFIWETAITSSHVVKSDENLLKPIVQIHEKLFLDALQAYKENDSKKSLLYCAISAESFVTNKLDAIYESLLQNPNSSLKIIADNSTANVTYKDPIYEFLKSKRKFAECLHELPLYLIGKSLQAENHSLYQKLIKLYKTRNNIAHLGESVQPNDKVYEESSENALEALINTLSLFAWFGENNNFPVPIFGMVKGKSARTRIVETDANLT